MRQQQLNPHLATSTSPGPDCTSAVMTTDSAAPPALFGRPAWIISDGKLGHEVQCLGVAAALGVEPILKHVAPTGIYRLAAPWGPVASSERFGQSGSAFAPRWPAIAFAAGRTTIPYIRALKRRAGDATFTVILLDPRVGAAAADLIWVPEHDRLRGPNVITTLTSPHSFSPERLARLRAELPADIAALPRPRIAVLIGGPNRDYRYDPKDASRLATAISGLGSGASLMITASRRTPPDLFEAVLSAARDFPRIVWSGAGDNPYPSFLAAADAFLVTADSVNMTGEAAATGRPIHVFRPSGAAEKFDRFHGALERYGAARPLQEAGAPLATWSYEPLDSAARIADEILKRWRSRAEPASAAQ